VHGVSQPGEPGPDPAFDRPDGHAEDGRDLVVGVPAVESEQDGLALGATQPFQRHQQLFGVQDVLHGLAYLVPADRGDRVLPFPDSFGGDGANPVDRAAARDGEDPRPGRAPARIEPVSRAPYL
jgi:hypothetical protein